MKKGKPNPRRAELAALSMQVRPLVKSGQFDSVNDAIRAIYSAETGQTTWNTFKGWKTTGFVVRKGSQGFPVWATPREMKQQAQDALQASGEAVGPGANWFPVAYLFHAGQVDRLTTAREG